MAKAEKSKIDSVDIGLWIIVGFVFYLIICFLSWVVIKIATEWGYVIEYPAGVFNILDNAQNNKAQLVVDSYNLINLPRRYYLYFLENYKITTLAVSTFVVFVVWGLFQSEN